MLSGVSELQIVWE